MFPKLTAHPQATRSRVALLPSMYSFPPSIRDDLRRPQPHLSPYVLWPQRRCVVTRFSSSWPASRFQTHYSRALVLDLRHRYAGHICSRHRPTSATWMGGGRDPLWPVCFMHAVVDRSRHTLGVGGRLDGSVQVVLRAVSLKPAVRPVGNTSFRVRGEMSLNACI
ncbi:hypothetical protein C8Q76DRAFT_747401, partial [Earliella scabrosa]